MAFALMVHKIRALWSFDKFRNTCTYFYNAAKTIMKKSDDMMRRDKVISEVVQAEKNSTSSCIINYFV